MKRMMLIGGVVVVLAFASWNWIAGAQTVAQPRVQWEYATFSTSLLGGIFSLQWHAPDGDLKADVAYEAGLDARTAAARDLYAKIVGVPYKESGIPYGVLNAAGARGWELCQLKEAGSEPTLYLMLFKRQK